MGNAQTGTLAGDIAGFVGVEASREISDQQLLERFIAQRDEAAFVSLVRRYAAAVWGICRRMLRQEQDAEDAFQAVFLILARKAKSIRNGEAVGSWLYGVAYRTAMKARQLASSRAERDKKASVAKAAESPPTEAAWRELQRQLDEELQRLGDKYRAPFVLCCLEGMSRAEAAKELGLKEGTVSSRLAQARKLLQSRLARRGISLAAVMTAVALAQQTAAAAAPALLVQGTVQAVLTPLSSEAAAVTLSPSALALAESSTPALAAVKLKLGVLFAALALVTGLGLAAYQFAGPDEVEQPEILGEAVTFKSQPVRLFRSIDERVFVAAFSPDSTKLITAGGLRDEPGQLKVWNIPTGDERLKVRGIRGVRTVAFSPDGKSFATGDFGGDIKLRDADTGAEKASVKGHTVGVNGLAFSPDGESLLSAGLDKIVKLWAVKGLKERKAFPGHTDMVYAVAFFRDGETFVTGGADHTAKIWNIRTGKEKFTLRGHKLGVEAVAVSPDAKIVATASWDRTIKLWNAETGAETDMLKDGETAVFAVAFSRDGKLLAGAGADGKVRLWDVQKRGLIKILGQHSAAVFSLSFSRDDEYLASGSLDSTAKLWDMKELKEIATLKTTEFKPIQALAYAPDGKTVAMATDDNTVRICDTRTGDVQVVKTNHTDVVTCVAFARDGKLLATGSADKTVKLLNQATGKQKTLTGHAGAVRAVVFTPDGKKLASAGDDKTIKIWDSGTGEEWTAFQGHESAVRALAFASNGRTLASGSEDDTVRLWYLDKKTEPIILKAHDDVVRAVAFSGSHLASADDDGVVKVWRADSGAIWKPAPDTEPLTLRGHTDGVTTLAFAPGGRTLVSGSQDQTMIVWDIVTGQPQQTLKGHKGDITALAIHPQGNDLISGGLDKALLRWPKADGLLAAGEKTDEAQPKKDGKDGPVVKKLPDMDPAAVVELLEEATDAFIESLDSNGANDASVAARDEKTFFSGTSSLAVTSFQRFKLNMPGWRFKITENPRPGEFRYLRFAWKRTEAPGIMLQLHVQPNSWKRYYAGSVSERTQTWGHMIRVADEPPRKWELVTRDLVKDLGPITITGIGFSAMEGPGEAYFDHIYLGRSIEDLDRVTERLTKAVDPGHVPPAPAEQTPSGRAWLVPAALVVAAFVFVVAAVLLVVVIRRGAQTKQPAPSPDQQPAPDPVKPPVICVCAGCGRKLKLKAALAGKTVKCARCGKSVHVPEPKASP